MNSLNPYYFISRIKSFKGLNLVGFLSKIMSSTFYRRINYRIRNFIEDNMLFILIFETFFDFFSFWLIYGEFCRGPTGLVMIKMKRILISFRSGIRSDLFCVFRSNRSQGVITRMEVEVHNHPLHNENIGFYIFRINKKIREIEINNWPISCERLIMWSYVTWSIL